MGNLLPVNSDSIYDCHRKSELKGGFPFLSDEKTKGKYPKQPGMEARSHGPLAHTSPLFLHLGASSEGPALMAPPLLLFCCFLSRHSFSVELYRCVSVWAPNACLSNCHLLEARGCICFIVELQCPAHSQPHRVPNRYI